MRPWWYCTMKRKRGVRVIDEFELKRGKKDWRVEVWEDDEGHKGILIAEDSSDYCFIVPSAISKKDKEKLILENTKLPKYMKEFIERKVFSEIG